MADIFNEIKQKLSDFFDQVKKVGDGFSQLPGRLNNIKRGFEDSGQGIKLQFVNLGKSFALGGEDIGRLLQLLGETVYKSMVCFYYLMGNIRCCFIFYLVDFLGQIIYLIIQLVVFILRIFSGIDLRDRLRQMHTSLDQMDEIVYNYFGNHITKFPDTVVKKCYTCPNHFSLRDSIHAIKQQSEDINVDFKRTIPDLMNEPQERFIRAGREFKNAFA